MCNSAPVKSRRMDAEAAKEIQVEALLSQQPKLKSMFMKRHVLSMREFSREEIDSVLDLAASGAFLPRAIRAT
jgi:hypothetical protein